MLTPLTLKRLEEKLKAVPPFVEDPSPERLPLCEKVLELLRKHQEAKQEAPLTLKLP